MKSQILENKFSLGSCNLRRNFEQEKKYKKKKKFLRILLFKVIKKVCINKIKLLKNYQNDTMYKHYLQGKHKKI